MNIQCKYEKLVPAATLVEHEMNANKHPERQIQMLAKILKYQGWRHPIVVSKLSGKIVAGHGRLAAAKLNDWDQVPVDMQDFEDKAQELAFLASDNIIAELADRDDEALIALIKDTDIDDLELFGLDDFKLPKDDDERREEIEDEVPDVTESISRLGDVYELGVHRLICGDSTDSATVARLMNGEKADMVFTDPPYGMNLDTNYDEMFKGDAGHKNKGDRFTKVIGDDKPYDPTHLMQLAKDVFLWGADYFYDKLPVGGSWSAWDKRNDVMDAVIGNTTEFLWSKNPRRRMTARVLWSGHHGMGKGDEKKRIHPTQKPLALIDWFFINYCKSGESVIDLFGGSGSTLIACEKTNRKCYMMELDPHYIDVIVSRWCKYTGKTEIKRNGEPMEWTLGQTEETG